MNVGIISIGILFGSYIGVKLFEKFSAKKTKKNKSLSVQSVNKPQDKQNEIILNKTDKKYDHYFLVSTANLGLTIVRTYVISPPIALLNIGMFTYTTLPILKMAEKSLIKKRRIGNDAVIFIFTFMSLATNHYFILCLSHWFYHLANKILSKTQNHSKQMLTNVFEHLPQVVWVLKDNLEIEVPLEALHVNDIVVVNTGEVIPVDGIITEGMAMIDQQALTGESQPAEKGIGDKVFASTVVFIGRICVNVEQTGKETTFLKINQILNHAIDFKTNTQSWGEALSDKTALPFIALSTLALAILGPEAALIVLYSNFGGRIKLLAPLGTLNHLTSAYQKGMLIKDGRALEALNQVDTILFDKTGTLTTEQPEVGQIILCNDESEEDEILTYAAAAERKLTHPIAKAILQKAKTSKLSLPDIDDSQYHIGYGITVMIEEKIIQVGSVRFMVKEGIAVPEKIEEAMAASHTEGHSLVMVAINHHIHGAIEIQASVRPEVKQIISDLRQRGIKHIAIVSGDHKEPTQSLAERLGMDSYYAEVLPENKANIVEQLQKQGKVVCFVGDGINDAIAMKKANVSISLRGASSIATDIAQVVLMDGSLSHLAQLFDISNSLETNIRNSLGITIVPTAINIAGIFLFNIRLTSVVTIKNVLFLVGVGNAMLPPKSEIPSKAGLNHPERD